MDTKTLRCLWPLYVKWLNNTYNWLSASVDVKHRDMEVYTFLGEESVKWTHPVQTHVVPGSAVLVNAKYAIFTLLRSPIC